VDILIDAITGQITLLRSEDGKITPSAPLPPAGFLERPIAKPAVEHPRSTCETKLSRRPNRKIRG
jgi:hypothetical protein